jgi:hypothetical protein
MSGTGSPRYVEIAEHLRREARRAPAGTLLPSEPAWRRASASAG